MEQTLTKLLSLTLGAGAHKASIIGTEAIETDRAFRGMCESNACGAYGGCYMCPPDVGDIDALMTAVKTYRYALVYQTVTALEDSYDYEGMLRARKDVSRLAQHLRRELADAGLTRALHLSVGGCGVCEVCAKKTNEPCRFPELAMPSLEAYGINVSELARSAGMKYTNGSDTVTYFGAILFNELSSEN